jgi:hypothetical protein
MKRDDPRRILQLSFSSHIKTKKKAANAAMGLVGAANDAGVLSKRQISEVVRLSNIVCSLGPIISQPHRRLVNTYFELVHYLVLEGYIYEQTNKTELFPKFFVNEDFDIKSI